MHIVCPILRTNGRACVFETTYGNRPGEISQCRPRYFSPSYHLAFVRVVFPEASMSFEPVHAYDPFLNFTSVLGKISSEPNRLGVQFFASYERMRSVPRAFYPYAIGRINAVYNKHIFQTLRRITVLQFFPPALVIPILTLSVFGRIKSRRLFLCFLSIWLTIIERTLRSRIIRFFNVEPKRAGFSTSAGLLKLAMERSVRLAIASRASLDAFLGHSASLEQELSITWASAEPMAELTQDPEKNIVGIVGPISAELIRVGGCDIRAVPLEDLGFKLITALTSIPRHRLPAFGEGIRAVVRMQEMRLLRQSSWRSRRQRNVQCVEAEPVTALKLAQLGRLPMCFAVFWFLCVLLALLEKALFVLPA